MAIINNNTNHVFEGQVKKLRRGILAVDVNLGKYFGCEMRFGGKSFSRTARVS